MRKKMKRKNGGGEEGLDGGSDHYRAGLTAVYG